MLQTYNNPSITVIYKSYVLIDKTDNLAGLVYASNPVSFLPDFIITLGP
jgi:hypothetical protein